MANKTNTRQAYCPELGRIITVAEAWDYTFGDKRLPVGVQLSFQCSVEGCPAKLITHNFHLYSGSLHEARFRLYPYTLMSCPSSKTPRSFQNNLKLELK